MKSPALAAQATLGMPNETQTAGGLGSASQLPPSAAVGKRVAREPNEVERKVLALIEQSRTQPVASEILMPLYRQLEPVSVEFMLSTWHGSLFAGKPAEGWWGKNMISAELVQPLLFQRPDGTVYSNEVWGLATLKQGSCYGLSQTAMLVYNDKPLKDYFRRVTDETVIGLTPAELLGADFFFQLTRDHATQVES